MIGSVFPTGRHVQVSGGTASTYVNGYSGSQGVGNMRYNTSSQRMEVFDGSGWVQLNLSSASVGLNSEAESLLDWAREKRNEEHEWYKLASSNEAVRIALDQLEQAKTRLQLTAILARDNEQTTS